MSADTNFATLRYAAESSLGVLPLTPTVKTIRLVSETLAHQKDTVESEEIRSDRQIVDVAKVGSMAQGDFNFELSWDSFEDFFEGVFFSDITDISVSSTAAIGAEARAVGTLTLTANPANADTVTIGSRTYNFRTSLTNVAGYVLIGASASATLDNLVAAINGAAGAGTTYAASTTQHPLVTAAPGAGDTVVVTAITPGTAGNSIGTTDTLTDADDGFGAATLINGDSANTLTAAAATYTGVPVGGFVKIAGAATPANNGRKRVLAKNNDGSVLSFASGSFTTDEASPTIALTGRDLRNGITKKSFTFERDILDANTNIRYYQRYVGAVIGGMTLTFTSKEIVKGSFTIMGLYGEAESAALSGSPVAPSTTDVMNATSHVGEVWGPLGPSPASFKEVAITINNNLRGKDRIGQEGLFDIGVGTFQVTGSQNVYFESNELYQAMLDHDDTQLAIDCEDAAGNCIAFSLLRVKVNGGEPNLTGRNADVMQQADFNGLMHKTILSTMVCSLIPAA